LTLHQKIQATEAEDSKFSQVSDQNY